MRVGTAIAFEEDAAEHSLITQVTLSRRHAISRAIVGVVAFERVHLAVGPALSIQHWNGAQKAVAGAWFDASFALNKAFVARAQYRRYPSILPDPALRGSVSPSLVFVGMGVNVVGGR